MTTFYEEMQQVAIELLTEFGTELSIVRPNAGGTFDPAEGEYTGQIQTTITGVGALVPYETKFIDGKNILASDRQLIFQPNVGVPEENDQFIVNGSSYSIVSIETVSPAGIDVVYLCQARA